MLHRYDDGPARGWPGRVGGGVTGTGGRSGAEGKRSGGKVSEQPSLAVGPGITGPALQRCLATTLRCAPEQIGTPRFASVSSRQNPCVGQNATRPPPCMRWRGPCLASPHGSGQLPGLPSAARRPPGPDTRAISRSPGSFSRPRSCPQVVSVSNGESISTPSASCRARVCGHSFQVSSLSTRCPQNEAAYPHLSAVIHRFLHKKSTGDVM